MEYYHGMIGIEQTIFQVKGDPEDCYIRPFGQSEWLRYRDVTHDYIIMEHITIPPHPLDYQPICHECEDGCDGELCPHFIEMNKANYPDPEVPEEDQDTTATGKFKKAINDGCVVGCDNCNPLTSKSRIDCADGICRCPDCWREWADPNDKLREKIYHIIYCHKEGKILDTTQKIMELVR